MKFIEDDEQQQEQRQKQQKQQQQQRSQADHKVFTRCIGCRSKNKINVIGLEINDNDQKSF